MQARDRRAVHKHLVEQSHAPQRGQAGRLQQEAGADRTRGRGLFEDLDAMSVAREGNRGGLAAGAVSDDGDAHKKAPLCAGLSERNDALETQATGTTPAAWAPFGPWTTS
jgi:hypothetical protein